MAEQLQAWLPQYVGSNVFSLLLILICIRKPHVGRTLFAIGFLAAGLFNTWAVTSNPQTYVAIYGSTAIEPYRLFITGPFAANPALVVIPIALGQVLVGLFSSTSGQTAKLGLLGSMLFLLAICPLGVGSAFPAPLLMAIAALQLFTLEFSASLPAEAAASIAGLRSSATSPRATLMDDVGSTRIQPHPTSNRVLVAYATKHGSTREVAQAVARELEAHGGEVQLLSRERGWRD